MILFLRALATSSLLIFPGVSLAQEPQPATELSWQQITESFEVPRWYADARFGIWLHWGAQSLPSRGGGWYARHMYMQDVGREKWGEGAYEYQCATWGHPSEAGYMEVLNSWKADQLDAPALVDWAQRLGAQYFVVLANHHDHFDNWDSSHHPWNSMRVGPRRDLVGEFAEACREAGMRFGVSSHDDRHLEWWKPAFGADATGPRAGIPYDAARLTAADGRGQWWEGLDPADLYGLPPDQRSPEWVEKQQETWELRHTELVERYHPDLLWFDGHGFPYGDHGRRVCQRFYNLHRQAEGGFDGIVVGKIPGERAIGVDLELGIPAAIRPGAWQGTVTSGSWFYKEDREPRQNARTMAELLADASSKGGNLLINLELEGDGTIPAWHRLQFERLGAWVTRNAEAIFATRPWRIHGDNLGSGQRGRDASETDLAAAARHGGDHFNLRTLEDPSYGRDEVRFTQRDDILYVFVLNPSVGWIELPSLAQGAEGVGQVRSARMIGHDGRVDFEQTPAALRLWMGADRPDDLAVVYALEGALTD